MFDNIVIGKTKPNLGRFGNLAGELSPLAVPEISGKSPIRKNGVGRQLSAGAAGCAKSGVRTGTLGRVGTYDADRRAIHQNSPKFNILESTCGLEVAAGNELRVLASGRGVESIKTRNNPTHSILKYTTVASIRQRKRARAETQGEYSQTDITDRRARHGAWKGL